MMYVMRDCEYDVNMKIDSFREEILCRLEIHIKQLISNFLIVFFKNKFIKLFMG